MGWIKMLDDVLNIVRHFLSEVNWFRWQAIPVIRFLGDTRCKILTAVVTGRQGMLTPPRHLLPHLWYIQRPVLAPFFIQDLQNR
jgi:hypothetical protein